MEATLGSTNEARPADLWETAERQRLDRKKYTNPVPGGRIENRERFREAMTQAIKDKRARNEVVHCPECGEIYSRGYVGRHRKAIHDVDVEQGRHCHYVQAVRPAAPKALRPICPECGEIFQSRYIPAHRREAHGAISRRGYHDVEYQYTRDW